MSKTVAIIQSSYIPWKGYFDIIRACDEFLLYDDVQYTKRDWRSRNQIKTANGLKWLSVPVRVKGRYEQLIKDTLVSEQGWAAKHWNSIRHEYGKAAHFPSHGPLVEKLFAEATFERLSDSNRHFLTGLCKLLGVETKLSWSMDYEIEPTDDKTERLARLCAAAGATRYLAGPASRDYLEQGRFDRHNIAVKFVDYSMYPEYPQLHGAFEHGVTVIDLILNCGDSSAKYLKQLG